MRLTDFAAQSAAYSVITMTSIIKIHMISYYSMPYFYLLIDITMVLFRMSLGCKNPTHCHSHHTPFWRFIFLRFWLFISSASNHSLLHSNNIFFQQLLVRRSEIFIHGLCLKSANLMDFLHTDEEFKIILRHQSR